MCDMSDAVRIDLFGINEVNGGAVGYVGEEARGGVDIERSAHDHHDVCLASLTNGWLDHRDRLAKPYDKRSQLRPVGSEIAHMQVGVLGIDGISLLRIAHGSDFHQLAMEVDHLATAGALVEVVYILRHDGHIVLTLQLG